MTGSQPKKKSGFTLIELLITVGVISILASIVVVVMPAQLKKARDTQRKSDLAKVQKALVLYYQDKGRYPCGQFLDGVGPELDSPLYELDNCDFSEPPLSSYINPIPEDPKAELPFVCGSQFNRYGYTVSDHGDTYTLYAKLETIKDTPYEMFGCSYNYKVETP